MNWVSVVGLGSCSLMDALELPFPMDVAVPKLMGSDGFVRAGVTVKEAEAREQGGVPVLVSPPIARCSSVLRKKGKFFSCFSTGFPGCWLWFSKIRRYIGLSGKHWSK